MQLSKTQLFVFMEGQENDPYFYSKTCQAVCEPAGIFYEHRIAKEVPPGAGGKNALIQFFRYLRRNNLLVNDFKGKRTTAIFFLDKDIDDLLRTQLRSPHVVYTRYYDIENHLFAAADIAEAAAAAASYDKAQITRAIGNVNDWRSRAASTWRDWIKLCVFARKHSIGGEYNYRVTSRINNPLTGPTDSSELALRLNQLQLATGLSNQRFKRAFRRVSKLVDDLFTQGNHDVVFKGKWYATFLEAEIRAVAGTRPYKSQNLTSRLLTAVALTVSFDDPWAQHFKDAVSQVIGFL